MQVLPHIKIAAILKKIKNTSSQTNKDRIQRGEQMQSLFELENANEISGAHLLLIDDVLTTGATLEAACTCLWQAQPHSISIAAAAYTL